MSHDPSELNDFPACHYIIEGTSALWISVQSLTTSDLFWSSSPSMTFSLRRWNSWITSLLGWVEWSCWSVCRGIVEEVRGDGEWSSFSLWFWKWELEPCWLTLPWMRRALRCCSVICKTSSSEYWKWIFKCGSYHQFTFNRNMWHEICCSIPGILWRTLQRSSMQVTMKLPLQSITARQFKVYFRIWSLCELIFGDDILTCQEDVISQKAF